jgi:hypothetical protein
MNEFDKQFKRPCSNYIQPKEKKAKPDEIIKYVIYNANDNPNNLTAKFADDNLSATEFMKNVLIVYI